MTEPNFEGHAERECGDHRTLGSHRAWCFDCTEYCYPNPDAACKGCAIIILRAENIKLETALARVRATAKEFGPWYEGRIITALDRR